jgi:hypothetical protein
MKSSMLKVTRSRFILFVNSRTDLEEKLIQDKLLGLAAAQYTRKSDGLLMAQAVYSRIPPARYEIRLTVVRNARIHQQP